MKLSPWVLANVAFFLQKNVFSMINLLNSVEAGNFEDIGRMLSVGRSSPNKETRKQTNK